MDIVYVHGPDRTPFDVAPDAGVIAADATPFHGVVSRGLRSWLDAHTADGPAVWERNAHRLDAPDAQLTPELLDLRRAAAELGVLSFGQSALVATRYVARLGGDSAELWNTKEGHTSSVWVTTPDDGGRFVLNVARDLAAGEELRDSSSRMRRLTAVAPEVPIATVQDIATVELDGAADGRAVVVVRNALIDDAVEVHRLPGGRGYALVDRFVPDDGVPARIGAAHGRVATTDERAAIEGTIESALAAATSDLPIALNVNHGDVVWDGTRAHVVAIA